MTRMSRLAAALAAFACLAFTTTAASAATRTGVIERAHAHQRDGGTRYFWALSTRYSLEPVSIPRPWRYAGKRVRISGRRVTVLGRPLARAAVNDRDVVVILTHFSN